MDKELKRTLGRLEHKLDCTFLKLVELEDFFKDDYYKKMIEEAKAKKENAEWEFTNTIERARERGNSREEQIKNFNNYVDWELVEEKYNGE